MGYSVFQPECGSLSSLLMGLAAKHLNPQFKIKGVAVVMSTAELAGIPNRSLGNKVASLKSKHDEIIAALDLLFTGI